MTEYQTVGILIIVVIILVTVIMLLAHLIGPSRHGPVKDSTYESGVEPVGDARRRFNVRFYMVAMLFLLFDVEIVFFLPWAILAPRLNAGPGSPYHGWASDIMERGFGPGFLFVEMLIFIGVLAVGYLYAWRKDVFRWD